MPDGGTLIITTGVSVLSAEDLLDNTDATPGRFVTVSIQDSGSGMSDLVLKKVFEPFFTTKEIGKGSGLGLSQVFGFVRQSHGHVRLRQHRGNRHPRNDLPALPEQPENAAAIAKAPQKSVWTDLRRRRHPRGGR